MGNDLRNPIPPPIYAKFALKIITPFGKNATLLRLKRCKRMHKKSGIGATVYLISRKILNNEPSLAI